MNAYIAFPSLNSAISRPLFKKPVIAGHNEHLDVKRNLYANINTP